MTSSAIRCKAIDEHGHRCKRKAGHGLAGQGTKVSSDHESHGHTWKGKGHP